MNEQELARQFADHDLTDWFEAARPVLRPAIQLDLESVDDATLPVGRSKFGGLPDLPPDMDWPQDGGRAMALVAQINFAEVQASAPTADLPADGLLWLFYEIERSVWGYDPADASGFAVRYAELAPTDLQRRPRPDNLPEAGDFSAATLRFTPTVNVPDYPSELVDYEMDGDENDRLWGWREETDATINKLLGHSDNVQNPQELECQLVSHGLYCGDASGYEDPRRAELEPGVADWRLLLQIDSNEDACDMMWGDCGRLYVWIRDADLQARRFDRCWLILQCY